MIFEGARCKEQGRSNAEGKGICKDEEASNLALSLILDSRTSRLEPRSGQSLIDRKALSGFTLIELSVVLFIMVLGFGLIGVNLSSGHAGTEINAAAREMASALRYARGQALMTREETSVTIDFGDNAYSISTRDRVYRLPEAIHLTLVTAQSEWSSEGQAGIRFFPDGSSTGGRLTLERDAWVKKIDINWLTGHIEFVDD